MVGHDRIAVAIFRSKAAMTVLTFSFLLHGACGVGAAPSSTTTPGSPVLSVTPSSIDFGSMNVGTASSKTLTISNTGTASIGITAVSVTGNYLTVAGVVPPTTVAPSQSVTLTVKFAPTAAGTVTGSLAITTDTQGKNLSIALNGTGVAPGVAQLSASPSPVAFGSVSVGSTTSKTVIVTNVGSVAASVASVSFTGAGFSVSGISAPLSLNAGQNVSFTTGFAPSSAGTSSGSVFFKDGTGATLLTIAMSGTATSAVAHSVDLTWAASTSQVSGYHVYRGQVSGGPYTLLTPSVVTGTQFTDNNVLAGTSYFYVVTAVDVTGSESSYSNQVAVVVPVP